jgi:hypothetical protein
MLKNLNMIQIMVVEIRAKVVDLQKNARRQLHRKNDQLIHHHQQMAKEKRDKHE